MPHQTRETTEPAPADINYGVSSDTTRPGAYDHIEKHTIPKSYIP
ncbi:MAG: hypothetical protein SPH78_07675 [Muribaculaceae bacterium]|nr:hypothetical protein [Bacteroidales bacterium]MDY6186860.1 hypothetical protein [Muribaculaceae bacterium]DAO86489.1 MAG TPA: hypothetical protein [Caudoviricetes sp.]